MWNLHILKIELFGKFAHFEKIWNLYILKIYFVGKFAHFDKIWNLYILKIDFLVKFAHFEKNMKFVHFENKLFCEISTFWKNCEIGTLSHKIGTFFQKKKFEKESINTETEIFFPKTPKFFVEYSFVVKSFLKIPKLKYDRLKWNLFYI